MARKKTRSRRITRVASPTTTITGAQLRAGAKFGYRLVKSVDSRNVTFVNTNGCKPSNKPATVHTVTRGEFLALVN